MIHIVFLASHKFSFSYIGFSKLCDTAQLLDYNIAFEGAKAMLR